MSYHEYLAAKKLVAEDPPFYALIMAAMHKADTNNTEKLKIMWPDVWGRRPSSDTTHPGDCSRASAMSSNPKRRRDDA